MPIMNLDGATLVGTLEQIRALLEQIAKSGVMNMDRPTFVILGEPLTKETVRDAIEATPRRAR